MKTLITVLLAAASIAAQATQCGFPPYPPYGMEYVCVCDAYGANCRWVLVSKR